MIRFIKSLFAIFFPWLVLFIDDNPGGAIVALIMQVSLIGWPFASLWALRVQRENREEASRPSAEDNEED